jgi:hypothetical protein
MEVYEDGHVSLERIMPTSTRDLKGTPEVPVCRFTCKAD